MESSRDLPDLGNKASSTSDEKRCARCLVLYPTPGDSLCSYCQLRANAPETLGPADVEAPLRDRVKEEQNATKIVQFVLGLVWILLAFGTLAAIYGIGLNQKIVSPGIDHFYELFIAVSSVILVALIRPVTKRLLRWLNKNDPEEGKPRNYTLRDDNK